MTIYAKIIGTGSCLPPREMTNDDIAAMLAARGVETSDEWIKTRSGISTRYFAEPGVQTSDLGAEAARKALEMAQCYKNDIDMILMATITPDFIASFPSTACIVQKKLGITNGCGAADVSAVCSGFLYALSMADALIRAGVHKKVLVIAAEILTRIIDFNDRTTCVLFGDGAGAIVLGASEEPGVMATCMHADGNYGDILSLPVALIDGALQGNPYVYMDGTAVFKHAIHCLGHASEDVLGKAGLQTQDIDWLIPHQANIRIMEGSAKRLKIPQDSMVVTVGQHGNTSAASIPLALDVAFRDGRIRPGQNVLMVAIGGGLTWAAAVAKM